MDKVAWEAVIPSMGYMALMRNLRNFQDAGVSSSVMKSVLNKLSDSDEVRKSMQFPFRFLSAYQANSGNIKIQAAMEEALEASLSNVPVLKGKTLILVDRSPSMFPGWAYSGNTKDELSNADKAAIFGSALALRAEDATLVQYGDRSDEVPFRSGDSVLPMLTKFKMYSGTETARAIRKHFDGHDRVIVITDEQYQGSDPSKAVSESVPMYTWNLVGYATGSKSGSQKRHTFAGLTDKAFQQIGLIESGQHGTWPWEFDTKG
jgi:hypothetical protein